MKDNLKRKRGGQKDNQNARKHGFYSRSLSPSEICQFLNITNTQGTDREIAVLRIKLQSVLSHSPGNRRVLIEAARLLVNWEVAKYQLDRVTGKHLKKAVRSMWANLPNSPL